MKTLAAVLILGVVLLSANASILEHIYNNTRLRGNVKMNTDNGVKLGYDGSLSFDNGIFGFEIARVGGNFSAVQRPGGKLGNTTNGTIDYSGNIQVVAAKNKAAQIGVNGTAGLYVEYDLEKSENGGSLGYNTTLTNQAEWQVTAGDNAAAGTTGAILNVTGRACKEGDKVYVQKKFYGAHGVSGNVTDGEGTHTFRVVNFGRGGLKKKLFINQDHAYGPLPTVVYKGIGGIKRAQYIRWDDNRIQNLNEAGAKFGGLVWAENGENNNSWFHNIKHAKNADYIHKGATIVNDEIQALYAGTGTLSNVGAASLQVTKDKTNITGGVFQTGDLHEVGVVIPNPEQRDIERIDKQFNAMRKAQENELEGKDFEDTDQSAIDTDFDDNNKGIKTYVHANWAGAKGVFAHVNDDNTTDVYTHGGAVWKAVGIDSEHKKPWHRHGGHAYNSTFEVDPNQGTISNVQIKFEQDPKKIEELRQKYQGIEMTVRRP